MGWRFPWVSSFGSEFNYEFNVSFTPEQIAAGPIEYSYPSSQELEGTIVFFRDLWARYFTPIPLWTRFRGNVGNYVILDLPPKGRNETGPHNNLMGGVHRHSHRNRMPVSGSGQDSHYLIVRRSESSSA